jgi:hypothetical protein
VAVDYMWTVRGGTVQRGELEKPKYTVIIQNTLVIAEIHLENGEIHLKIFQMILQWIENGEITHIKLK